MKKKIDLLSLLACISMLCNARIEISMYPECVSMTSNVSSLSKNISYTGKTNNVTFTVEGVQENNTYRLIDKEDANNIVSLTATGIQSTTYTGTAQIYYSASTGNQQENIITYKLQRLLFGEWVDVSGAEYTVESCHVECKDLNTSFLHEVSLFTTNDDCTIPTEKEFLSQITDKLPTANYTVENWQYSTRDNLQIIGSDIETFSKKWPNGMQNNEEIKNMNIWAMTADGNYLGQCQLTDFKVRACPKITEIKTFTADNSCVVSKNTIETELKKTFSTHYVVLVKFVKYYYTKICGNEVNMDFNSLSKSSYSPGLYTEYPWEVQALVQANYSCPQTFRVKAPSAPYCSVVNSSMSVETSNECGTDVSFTGNNTPTTTGLCSPTISWSRNGTTWTTITNEASTYTDYFFARATPYTIYWKVSDGYEEATCTTTLQVNMPAAASKCADNAYLSKSGNITAKYPIITDNGIEITYSIVSLKDKDANDIVYTESTSGISGSYPLGENTMSINIYNCGLLQSNKTCPVTIYKSLDICK